MRKWVLSNKKTRANVNISVEVKNKVTFLAQQLVDTKLKPLHIKKHKGKKDHNYIDDIYVRWYRNYFYFCAKYKSLSSNSIVPEFELKFARLEYQVNENYNLSYLRHNNNWFEIGRDINLDSCLSTIGEGALFTP